MLRSFGYHLVYSDAVGVNAFFVHEPAVGKEQLFSIAEAKQYFTQGKEQGLLHSQCVRHAWMRIDEGVDFSNASFDVAKLPVVFLGYKPGGDRYKQRLFYEIKVPASLQVKLGGVDGALGTGLSSGKSARLPAHAAAAKEQVPRLKHAVAAGSMVAGRAAVLQVWSVAALVVIAFACGALLQRFGGRLLHAGIVVCAGGKNLSV
jgi:hypothetical protein